VKLPTYLLTFLNIIKLGIKQEGFPSSKKEIKKQLKDALVAGGIIAISFILLIGGVYVYLLYLSKQH